MKWKIHFKKIKGKKQVNGLSTAKRIQKHDFLSIEALIKKKKVCCFFQPIFSNKANTIVKYEVLARIKDKNENFIIPEDFLPLIWGTNCYQDFTKQIIKKSIETFKNRKENFSINLGIQDILDKDVLFIIEDMAQKEPQTIKRMGIEILEYEKFEDINTLNKIFNKLKKYGISIILDDFGSGYANFGIVERLDFDEIKIDGSIVEHINVNKRAKDILMLLADFAIKNNIKTTVEYVSNKEIYDAIIKIPFNNLQGFYLGKPQRQQSFFKFGTQ